MIETERLHLHTLSKERLELLVAGDLDGFRATLPPYDVTDGTFASDGGVLAMRLAQLTEDPAEEPWLYRVAVRKGTRQVVGRAGFHARPDGDRTVEIGYSVAPDHRRQGYALEMARGLMAWAAGQGAVACLASVRPDNTASLTTISRLGFVRIGEQVDEVDGLEWVHRVPLV